MEFGKRLRELRKEKRYTLRTLADRVGVGFTYLSKIENHKLEEGHCPSEQLIHKLSIELDADEDELLLLAEKVPNSILRRVLARPDVFREFAELRDIELNQLAKQAVILRSKRSVSSKH